jgi:hypothetical protein
LARALGALTVGRALLSPRFGACLCIGALSCAYYIAIAPALLAHTDLGWHLAAGDLIRSQVSIPALDPWSFTAGDKRWYNLSWLSWLWDVLASALAAGGQTTALLFATIALGGLIALGLGAVCMANGASPLASVIAVTAAAILYPTFAAPDIFLAASPNIATLLFCVTVYGVSLHKRHLWLLPCAMVLWVNMHGGFVLGLFILGIFAGVALVKRDWPGFRTYSLLGLSCLAATLVNPLGWHVYQGVLATLGHFVQHYISEWQPLISSIKLPQALPALLYILVFVVLELSGLLAINLSRVSSPAKAGDPVTFDWDKTDHTVVTGCPAFAGHDIQ